MRRDKKEKKEKSDLSSQSSSTESHSNSMEVLRSQPDKARGGAKNPAKKDTATTTDAHPSVSSGPAVTRGGAGDPKSPSSGANSTSSTTGRKKPVPRYFTFSESDIKRSKAREHEKQLQQQLYLEEVELNRLVNQHYHLHSRTAPEKDKIENENKIIKTLETKPRLIVVFKKKIKQLYQERKEEQAGLEAELRILDKIPKENIMQPDQMALTHLMGAYVYELFRPDPSPPEIKEELALKLKDILRKDPERHIPFFDMALSYAMGENPKHVLKFQEMKNIIEEVKKEGAINESSGAGKRHHRSS